MNTTLQGMFESVSAAAGRKTEAVAPAEHILAVAGMGSDGHLAVKWDSFIAPVPTPSPGSSLAPPAMQASLPSAVRPNDLLSSRIKVIDGDTLDLGDTRIRLDGIDAPEIAQRCLTTAGESWRCGRSARDALTKMIGSAQVHCQREGTDGYDRVIATCFAHGRNLNEAMVTQGHALAFVKYSARYSPQEAEARRTKAGIWAGFFETPWAYRSSKWTAANSDIPNGCPIKGNISARGRIYHMPWSASYSRTQIDEAKGERWFCSEAEAIAAGWRAPV